MPDLPRHAPEPTARAVKFHGIGITDIAQLSVSDAPLCRRWRCRAVKAISRAT